MGSLAVSSYFDRRVQRTATAHRSVIGDHDTFIADQFVISIQMNNNDDSNGWPKVYDLEQRHHSIARRYRISTDDLHFYADGHACLGLTYPWDPPLTLRHFVAGLVEPFFYRLAYVDCYGLGAARTDLWPEYSHGKDGLREYSQDVRRGFFRSDNVGFIRRNFHRALSITRGLIDRNAEAAPALLSYSRIGLP